MPGLKKNLLAEFSYFTLLELKVLPCCLLVVLGEDSWTGSGKADGEPSRSGGWYPEETGRNRRQLGETEAQGKHAVLLLLRGPLTIWLPLLLVFSHKCDHKLISSIS